MKKVIIAVAVVAALAAGVSYTQHTVTQNAKSEIDKQFALLNKESGISISYQDASVNIFDKSLLINQLTLTAPDNMHLADVKSISLIGYEPGKITEYAEFKLQDLVVSSDVKKHIPPGIADEFINSSINLLSTMNYDASSDHANFKNKIESVGVADFKVDFALSEVKDLFAVSIEMHQAQQALAASGQEPSLEQQLQQQSKLMDAMMALKPNSVEIELANKGKLEAALTQLAQSQQMDLAQLKKVAIEQLAYSPAPELLKQGIQTFIEKLGSLNVAISFPEGMSVAQLQQPETLNKLASVEEMADFLNLKVSAN